MPINDIDPALPQSTGLAGLGDDEFRLLKQQIVDSWGGIDDLVTSGTGNPAATAADIIGLFDKVANLEGGVGSGFVNEIRMWYGTAENVPAGWYICDGSNGTPDLRDRFVFGADSTTGLPLNGGATTGGALPGSLTTGPAGGHQHTTSGFTLEMQHLPSTLSSSINISQAAAGQSDNHSDASSFARGAETPNADTSTPVTVVGANNVAHSHGDTAAVSDHTHSLDGASLPPWHAIYYIMYTGV